MSYQVLIGERKSLVFPVMCYGYLTADYDVSIDDLRKEGFTDIFSQVESGKLLREGLQESLSKVESKANAASQQVKKLQINC